MVELKYRDIVYEIDLNHSADTSSYRQDLHILNGVFHYMFSRKLVNFADEFQEAVRSIDTGEPSVMCRM